jgi:RNA-binding protein NOB1
MELNQVTSFSKKTGDYGVLSVADIHILALTYELECELNHGDWRLHKEPGSVQDMIKKQLIELEREKGPSACT